MKKLILFAILLFSLPSYAEPTATSCYNTGYSIASKAYIAGDRSAFTPGVGAAKKFMQHPCCTCKNEFACMGLNAAFQYVQTYGPTKSTPKYQENLQLMQMFDMGMFGGQNYRREEILRNIFSQAKIDLLAGLIKQTRELSFLFQQKETTSFTIETLRLTANSEQILQPSF